MKEQMHYFIEMLPVGCHPDARRAITSDGPITDPLNLRAKCMVCGKPATINALDARNLDTVKCYFQVDVDRDKRGAIFTPVFGRTAHN